ncbi:carbamoyltransferase HypF [Thiomicrorhabdus sp. ZW0627]|uniref:carbamoyltransferase HypF n=1 Tax=Thiomicrorhabdus sp. ZW0627 TaxID=3039774 RepID=UPI002436EEBB|nr:carbamoyltransferase HypF [Thiomicrorhabdus sp. ZW0627]MDG6774155.1 carbamoyltransferase HypF [Thiomicrorhabdus sp. ZW0627]
MQIKHPQHLRIQVSGRVQGVGFRPFIFQLAQAMQLKGSVCNDVQGVTIHLQGEAEALERFQQRLQSEAPKQAQILSMETESLPLSDYADFNILESESGTSTQANNQITPDIAVCENCLQEFHDPSSRRYHDPFINCSDCGPRFSILNRPAYDRSNSAMAAFELCESCESEYHDPANRRFHTQGICCPECGPKPRLLDCRKKEVAECGEAIQQAAETLDQAGLLAFKGVGGFHILCDATDTQAVATLRQRKHRPAKPFAVLCRDLEMAKSLADLTEHEIELLTSDARPIVLVQPKQGNELSDQVAPDIDRLGLFLAYSPLQHLLFEYFDRPLIATSANLSGEPIIYQAEEVFAKLCRNDQPVVDYVLDYDREIVNPCDDSIVQSIDGKTVTLRLARGLAPFYLPLKKDSNKTQQACSETLAVGAQQKSAVALAGNGQIVLSPYIGDLYSLASQQRFQKVIDRMKTLCRIRPKCLVSDLHPQYFSSRWAEKQAMQSGLELTKVQHHYAHVLACMAEFGLSEKVLAFSWDGTGFGEDGNLWGGEVMLADASGYERLLHLKPFKLLGGDLANQQPRRIALALLFDSFSLDEVLELDSPTVKAFSEAEIEQLHLICHKSLNSPSSSSMGRLFDAVASLLDLKQNLDYEGQSGLLLEKHYDPKITEAYGFEIKDGLIDVAPMIEQILKDHQQGVELSVIVSRFFNMLVNLIEQVSDQNQNLPVIVTGGVFQNKTLLKLLSQGFENKRQTLYFQQQAPINDGSIALGQVSWECI